MSSEDTSLIKRVFEKHGADIVGFEELKKIRLAYPIQKKQYGFLGSFRFKTDPQTVASLASNLKLENDVIRYMIVKAKEKKVEVPGIKPAHEVVSSKKALTEKQKREPTLTNEELEKKIEEILK